MTNPKLSTTRTRVCGDCGSRYIGECGICLDYGIDKLKDAFSRTFGGAPRNRDPYWGSRS